MRLINVHTRALEEFIGRNIPMYAILSHTWEEEEVSYADYIDGKHLDNFMKGFVKIDMACRLAEVDYIDYAWVDTCCIDKRSSAELTEAINSMFRWYEGAEVCYAFLSDLAPESASLDMWAALAPCRWFTRGWTLQELVAPADMKFFDSAWQCIGSKSSLSFQLTRITGITLEVLYKQTSLATIPVAEKMKWASNRVTTRVEDMAYCLLGIFDVNMPLMYGEEEKAFRRLQEEIIKYTPDLSIFAWKRPLPDRRYDQRSRTYCGILAEAPNHFSGSSPTHSTRSTQTEFSLSNSGVRFRSALLKCPDWEGQGSYYILPLYHRVDSKVLSVLLRKVEDDRFLRVDPWHLLELSRYPKSAVALLGSKYILTKPPVMRQPGLSLPTLSKWLTNKDIIDLRGLTLQIKLPPSLEVLHTWPQARFDDEDQQFFVIGSYVENQDWGIVKISSLPMPDPETQSPRMIPSVDCMFYATCWHTRDLCQYSLVPCGAYAKQISEVQADLSAADLDADSLLRALVRHEVPRSPHAIVEIPGTQYMVVIGFTSTPVGGSRLESRHHMDVQFSYEVRRTDDVLFIRHPIKRWNVPKFFES